MHPMWLMLFDSFFSVGNWRTTKKGHCHPLKVEETTRQCTSTRAEIRDEAEQFDTNVRQMESRPVSCGFWGHDIQVT